jgi:hypothetical protein
MFEIVSSKIFARMADCILEITFWNNYRNWYLRKTENFNTSYKEEEAMLT